MFSAKNTDYFPEQKAIVLSAFSKVISEPTTKESLREFNQIFEASFTFSIDEKERSKNSVQLINTIRCFPELCAKENRSRFSERLLPLLWIPNHPDLYSALVNAFSRYANSGLTASCELLKNFANTAVNSLPKNSEFHLTSLKVLIHFIDLYQIQVENGGEEFQEEDWVHIVTTIQTFTLFCFLIPDPILWVKAHYLVNSLATSNLRTVAKMDLFSSLIKEDYLNDVDWFRGFDFLLSEQKEELKFVISQLTSSLAKIWRGNELWKNFLTFIFRAYDTVESQELASTTEFITNLFITENIKSMSADDVVFVIQQLKHIPAASVEKFVSMLEEKKIKKKNAKDFYTKVILLILNTQIPS